MAPLGPPLANSACKFEIRAMLCAYASFRLRRRPVRGARLAKTPGVNSTIRRSHPTSVVRFRRVIIGRPRYSVRSEQQPIVGPPRVGIRRRRTLQSRDGPLTDTTTRCLFLNNHDRNRTDREVVSRFVLWRRRR